MSFVVKKEIYSNKFIKLFSVVGFVIVVSGCASPKILQERGAVPPPLMAPVEKETGMVPNEEELSIPILLGEEIIVSEESVIPKEEQELKNFPKVEPKKIEYVVLKGESFWTIAKKFGVGMKELAAYNNMDIKKPLKAGTTLIIPPGGKLLTVDEQKQANIVKTSSGKETNYIVKPGDSLWVISQRFGSSVNAITSANDISNDTVLKVGQKLYIPNKGPEKTVKPKALKNVVPKSKTVKKAEAPNALSTKDNNNKLTKEDTDLLNELIITDAGNESQKQAATSNTISFLPHTVKDGDTWNTISEMYGVSIDSLKKANPKISAESNLSQGTIVNIPEE